MFIQVYNMLFIEINETNFSMIHGLAVLKIFGGSLFNTVSIKAVLALQIPDTVV